MDAIEEANKYLALARRAMAFLHANPTHKDRKELLMFTQKALHTAKHILVNAPIPNECLDSGYVKFRDKLLKELPK